MTIDIGKNIKSIIVLAVILITAGLAMADAPLTSCTVYTIDCASTSHGTSLKHATAPVPRSAVKVKNEDSSLTIRIGPAATLDGADRGWEILPGKTEAIDSPITLWNCRGDSGTPKMKVMGGSV